MDDSILDALLIGRGIQEKMLREYTPCNRCRRRVDNVTVLWISPESWFLCTECTDRVRTVLGDVDE
jgi:uncharacterized protein YlaI